MSLKNAIQGAVNAGFNAAGDLRKTVTLTTVTGGTYDPVTDNVTGSTTFSLNVNAIIGSFTQYEIENSSGTILFNDLKLIVNSGDITITVDNTTTFTLDGNVYKIVNPANTDRSPKGFMYKGGDFVSIYQLRAM